MTDDIIAEKDNYFEQNLAQVLKMFPGVHLPQRGDDDGDIVCPL